MLTNQGLHVPPKTEALINVTGAGKGGQQKSKHSWILHRSIPVCGMSDGAGNVLHICPKYRERGKLTASPRRRETFPVLASSSTVSTCQEDGAYWLNLFSRGPHPDPGEARVPSDMAARGWLGHGHHVMSAGGRPFSSIHLFMY